MGRRGGGFQFVESALLQPGNHGGTYDMSCTWQYEILGQVCHCIFVYRSVPASAAIMRWFSRSFVVFIIAWSSRKPSAWRTPSSAAHTAPRSSGGMPPYIISLSGRGTVSLEKLWDKINCYGVVFVELHEVNMRAETDNIYVYIYLYIYIYI